MCLSRGKRAPKKIGIVFQIKIKNVKFPTTINITNEVKDRSLDRVEENLKTGRNTL